jgi:hypothetical protein
VILKLSASISPHLGNPSKNLHFKKHSSSFVTERWLCYTSDSLMTVTPELSVLNSSLHRAGWIALADVVASLSAKQYEYGESSY